MAQVKDTTQIMKWSGNYLGLGHKVLRQLEVIAKEYISLQSFLLHAGISRPISLQQCLLLSHNLSCCGFLGKVRTMQQARGKPTIAVIPRAAECLCSQALQ